MKLLHGKTTLKSVDKTDNPSQNEKKFIQII